MFKKIIGVLFGAALIGGNVYAQNDQQMETVRKIRANKQPTFGTWVYLKDPAITEMLAQMGYDWMIIDMEHGNLNEDLVQGMVVPLAGTKCVSIVRIQELDRGVINKLLDTGIQGILVPMIETKEDAENAVRYAKYPPQGVRGIGYGRAQGWGQAVESYLKKANEAILVGLIIETKEAVENIDEIVKVPGIDFVLAGTFDLSGSLGVLGKFDHALVLEAARKVQEAARRQNKPVVTWSLDQAGVEKALKQGSRLISLGGDVDFLGGGALNLLKAAQEAGRIR